MYPFRNCFAEVDTFLDFVFIGHKFNRKALVHQSQGWGNVSPNVSILAFL